MRVVLLTAALAAISLFTPARADDQEQSIKEMNAKYVAAVNNHDAKAWTALFADDAMLIPAGQPIVTGRENIEAWAELAATAWKHLEINYGSSGGDGNVVWSSGTWSGTVRDRDGKMLNLDGNYLTVAQKQGSGLLIKADTWNVNPPSRQISE